MLTTIQTVKDELGIKAENRDYDALIARNLKSTCARVRQQTNRWIHWAADNFNVAANGTTVTCRCLQHGIVNGTSIKVVASTTTTSLDGQYVVTRVDGDTLAFTMTSPVSGGSRDAWNLAGVTASAVIHPQHTIECRPTTIRDLWVPQRALPWQSVTEIAYWDGDNFVPLDADEWYTQFDQEPALAGRLVSVGSWYIPMEVHRGRIGLTGRSTARPYRIRYWAGAPECPGDILLATLSLMGDLVELTGGGKDRQSESHEGSSVTRMSGDERREHPLSPTAILANWRAR